MKTTLPYRTAEELGIEQWEHDGLAALVGPLSRDELRLDMQFPERECGTVACIGGWLALKAGINAHDYVNDEKGEVSSLAPLYWPRKSDLFPHETAYKATAPQAARAIVNFLTLGDPRWDDVMCGPA